MALSTETIQNDFKVLKNQLLNNTAVASSLILSIYKPLLVHCVGVCSANPNCKTAIY